MHVIVVGAGEVGRSIAQYLVREGHPVVVIDQDMDALLQLSETMDVQTIHGLGSRPAVLQQAGATTAEMVIAVTDSDEVNMVACQMAYSLYQIPKKIARVRDSSYLALTGSHLYSPDNLPVDVIISPEQEVAEAIERTMFVPGAFDVFPFAEEHLMMVGCKVGSKARIVGEKLHRWGKLEVPFEALCIVRGGRVLLPTKEDRLEPDDELYLLVRPADLETSLDMLGKVEPMVHNAFIIGGGNVGFNLAKMLEEKNVNVRVLDYDAVRASYLAEELSKSTVLSGDALNKELLQQENIGQMDAVLCVTSNDAVNMLTTLMVKEQGVANVLTLLHHANFLPLADSVGLDKVISPRQITVSRILRHVRRGHVVGVHTVGDNMGEVLELAVQPDSSVIGIALKDLNLPRGAVAGALVREGHEVVFRWEDGAVIQHNSHVIVFAQSQAVQAVEELFGG